MSDKEFKHEAVNELSIINVRINILCKSAMSDIKADLAIETRDLCDDLTNKIELFWQKHYPTLLKPDKEGVV
jgi:hypothetical protein